MYIIGITGGTGAGKSSAVQALQTLGALALDCDEIYHQLLISCQDMREEIEASFGDVTNEGKIDRRKLGEIVWSDPASLQDLNTITHKYIGKEIGRRLGLFKAQAGTLAVIDAIALIESGQNTGCDIVVGVIAPHEKRISRIMDRDKLTRKHAQKRITAQQPESYYKKNCDYILENNYDTQAEFEEKCIEFFSELLQKQNIQLFN